MAGPALDDDGFAPLDAFEPGEASSGPAGELAAMVALLQSEGDAAARAVVAKWRALACSGLEREALARIEAPTVPELRRLLSLYVQSGRWTAAARVAEDLETKHGARVDPPAALRWLAAGSPSDARRTAVADDPSAAVGRSLERGPELAATLAGASEAARDRGDHEAARALATDAWIAARGASGAVLAGEALRRSGRVTAGAFLLLEDAARRFADGSLEGPALVEVAAVAERAGLPGEAAAARTAAVLCDGAHAVRESLHDALADQERSEELAVRLRVDAWSAPRATRSAAWKGVAAIELPFDAMRATRALAEALRDDATDAEATDLLQALAAETATGAAVRDALWGAVNFPELSTAARNHLLLWVAGLEEGAGDFAAAEAAFARVDGPVGAAFEGLARVFDDAAQRIAGAEAAFAGLDAPDDAGVEALVAEWSAAPGAVAASDVAMAALRGIALEHAGAAYLWIRAARRSADPSALPAALRRLATRSPRPDIRREAVVECLSTAAFAGPGEDGCVELIRLYLDENPSDAALAAALAATAEHQGGVALAQEAARALARAAQDPGERAVLLRFGGLRDGVFAALGAAVEEPEGTAERCERLRLLTELTGETVTLLALRTRALMAWSGSPADTLAAARRFAEAAPWSPEAVFAVAALVRLHDDPMDIVDALERAVASCAGLPELASLARGAVARLAELGDLAGLEAVLEVGARAGLLADGAFANAALARGAEDAVRVEAACAAAEVPDPAWLDRLAGLAAHAADPVRALAVACMRGDAVPAAAAAALESLVHGAVDDAAQSSLVRAALAIGAEAAAMRWLEAWADGASDAAGATLRRRCAARIVWTSSGDATAALGWLRKALEAGGDVDAALRDAEVIAVRAGADAVAPMRAVFALCLSHAAGVHGTRALRYREAVFVERAGFAEEALELQLEVFLATRTIGAALTAVERLAGATGRWETLVRALEALAEDAPTNEARVQFLLRCADVARTRLRSPERSVGFEVRSWQASRSRALWDRVVERARAMRATHPAAATQAVAALIDGELAAAQQAWDDSVRGLHALQALECALTEAHDPERAAAAMAVYLGQHEAPSTARATVREMLDRPAVPEALQQALLASPLLSEAAPASPPAEPEAASDEALPAGLPADREWISFVAEPRPVIDDAGDEPILDAEPGTDVAPTEFAAAPGAQPVAPEVTPTLEAPAELAPADVVPVEATPLPAPPPTHVETAPPPPRPAAVTGGADVAEDVLRDAAARGDDESGARLARRLARDPDREHEAVAMQRARFDADPSRIDALDALVDIARRRDRRGEALGLAQVRAVLRGDPMELRPLHPVELEDPPDGVARVLLPARVGPFAELGALLWESVGLMWRHDLQSAVRGRGRDTGSPAARREALRSASRDATARPAIPSGVLRSYQAALRVLQLPRTTTLTLRAGPAAVDVLAQPTELRLPEELAVDSPAGHFALGHLAEGSRPRCLPMTALPAEHGDCVARALVYAFGPPPMERVDAPVAREASRLLDTIPARAHRQVRALVEELGPSLTPSRWRAVIDVARARAGLLVCGDFFEASRALLATAPAEVPRSFPWAFVEWEPLRELLRFAVSEEYLLLRWPNIDNRRRRVSSRPAPPQDAR